RRHRRRLRRHRHDAPRPLERGRLPRPLRGAHPPRPLGRRAEKTRRPQRAARDAEDRGRRRAAAEGAAGRGCIDRGSGSLTVTGLLGCWVPGFLGSWVAGLATQQPSNSATLLPFPNNPKNEISIWRSSPRSTILHREGAFLPYTFNTALRGRL